MSAAQKLACKLLNDAAQGRQPTLDTILHANGLGLVWTGKEFVAMAPEAPAKKPRKQTAREIEREFFGDVLGED